MEILSSRILEYFVLCEAYARFRFAYAFFYLSTRSKLAGYFLLLILCEAYARFRFAPSRLRLFAAHEQNKTDLSENKFSSRSVYSTLCFSLVCKIIKISLYKDYRCSLISGTTCKVTQRTDQVCQTSRCSTL